MSRFKKHLNPFFAACVQQGTRRLFHGFIWFFKERNSAFLNAICVAFIACLLFGTTNVLAGASVSFSKPKISLNETVELIFSSDEPMRGAPDLSSVSEHFRISGQSVQEMSSLVNNQLLKTYQVIFNLRPLKTGRIKLDILTLNGQKLNPIQIDVEKNMTALSSNAVLVLENSVFEKQIYVGSSFIYTVRLYDSSKILTGEFYAPTAEGADIEQFGQDTTYNDVKDGKSVEVFERRFLITPEKSGILNIQPAGFIGTTQANLKSRLSSSELFDMGVLFDGITALGASISAQGNKVSIQIKPKPSGWISWWLPSGEVTLTEIFKMPDVLKVGSTIERTLTLTAQGVEAEKLPDLIQKETSDFKVYPGQEQRKQEDLGLSIESSITKSVVLIPTKGGLLTIPSVQVPWFNTKTGKIEVAIVPEKQVQVTGDVIQLIENNPKEPVPVIISVKEEALQMLPPSIEVVSPEKGGMSAWLWIFLGIVIGMLTMGVAMLFFIGRKSAQKKKPLPDLYPF